MDGDWKVVYHYPVQGEARHELFNLARDPFEKNNLADAQPEQLKTMMRAMIDDMTDKGAQYPVRDGQQLKP